MLEPNLMKKSIPVRTSGFMEEVLAADFITGTALASAIGLTAGSAQNSDSKWMRFKLNGKTLMIPMRTIRISVTWFALYNRGAVFGDDTFGRKPAANTNVAQNARVSIGGKTYRVRLLKGANANPYVDPVNVYDAATFKGSEWNDVFYPITADPNITNDIREKTVNPPYSTGTLWMIGTGGAYSITQELDSTMKYALARGGDGPSFGGTIGMGSSGSNFAWRPCLELIE